MTGQQAKKLRKRLKMNQADFWRVVGVTQSGGCRHENGRRIPVPVLKLLAIAYGTDGQREAALKKLGVTHAARWVCGGVTG
jgi:hypothetical protein